MQKTKRTSLLFLLIFLGVFACAVPAVPVVDQNAAGTAVQQTLSAIIKQTEDAGQEVVDLSTDTPAPTYTPYPTFTPIQPTPTFPATATPTNTLPPPPPTFTMTPTVPMVSVSVATNCRVGPGKIYLLVGFLDTGRWVQVYARDPGNDYWYIRNPSNSSQFCWIWGEYATVVGLNGSLPVYTPPPSPTPTMTSTPVPDFDASYVGLRSCAGKFWLDFKLKNVGSATFRSVRITLRDVDRTPPVVVDLSRDDFIDRTDCPVVTTTKDTLVPGKSLTVSSAQLDFNPGGDKTNATITLCTSTGLNGYCVTQKMTFKP